MDSANQSLIDRKPSFALIRGEFAPVFWEPLGGRGERLVVGFLLGTIDGPTKAHITLHHKKLLDFISESKGNSAHGIIHFAFNLFNKTLDAGGLIQDLKSPFEAMSIGRTEAIAARTDNELVERATRLCTLLGNMPEHEARPDPTQVAARTAGFLRDVRAAMRVIDLKLGRSSLKAKQYIAIGRSQLRVHFHHEANFVQFCSLPMPNARVETATECAARLTELALIQRTTANSKVALCINTGAIDAAAMYAGKVNATYEVQSRTLDYANALDIKTKLYSSPAEAAGFLHSLV